MSRDAPKIRLHVADDLAAGRVVGLPADQAHYLRHVMRCRQGEAVALFNGRDGEWLARIDGLGKGWASLSLEAQRRPQAAAGDLWLCFAPIKRSRIDYLVEKATELGAARLLPVLTRRTDSRQVNLDRLAARAREAAEQCERLSVPSVAKPVALAALLDDWPPDRPLIFCDERAGAAPLRDPRRTRPGRPADRPGRRLRRRRARAAPGLRLRSLRHPGPQHPARRNRRAGGPGRVASVRRCIIRWNSIACRSATAMFSGGRIEETRR